jgi:hypothetical protein
MKQSDALQPNKLATTGCCCILPCHTEFDMQMPLLLLDQHSKADFFCLVDHFGQKELLYGVHLPPFQESLRRDLARRVISKQILLRQ